MADNDNTDSSDGKSSYQYILESAAKPECLLGFVAGILMPRKFAAGLVFGIIGGVYIQQTYVLPDVKDATGQIVKKVQENVPKKS